MAALGAAPSSPACEAEPGWCWLSDAGSGEPFPAYVGEGGRLIARPETSPLAPVAVISLPKAGTYLLGALLERLGWIDTELHVSSTFLTDYRGLSLERKRQAYVERMRQVPITVSAGLVGPGQFIVGHLPCEPWVAQPLARLKRIFLVRDLIDATLSHLRFWADSGRAEDAPWIGLPPSPERALAFLADRGETLVETFYRPMLGWAAEPDVFVLRFETLMGDEGVATRADTLAALMRFLDVEPTDPGDVLVRQVLSRPTKTFSGRRTDREVYWDNRVRSAFWRLGAIEMNATLGFVSPTCSSG